MAETPGPAQETRRRSLFSPRDKLKPVKAPPPPEKPRKRKSGVLAVISAFFTVSVIILLGVAMGVGYVRRVVNEPGPLQSDRAVVIERGAGAEEIAELLERDGIIRQPTLFQAMAMSQIYGKLKAGEFLFKREASLADVIDTIANGRAIEHNITIPEGLTSEQIVARVRDSDLLVGSIADIPPEGSLLPDTYKIQRGTSRDALVARMQRDQKRVLNEVWNKRAKDHPVKNANDLVILASVIEKETGRADERSRVAGVFVNRLNKNMKLQSDPTIVYGLVGGKGTLGRGITRADINSNTPYNTYVITGLPPTPIANPGRASLEAAANPSRTRDLFFVADGTGGHAFAETLEQHNRNVARWRQIEEQRDSAAQQPLPPAASPQAVPVVPSVPTAPGNRSEVRPLGTTPATTAAVGARDATEGTALDVLANKSFDLNSMQTMPEPSHPARNRAAQRQKGGFADVPLAQGTQKGRDASEGTKFDPLKNSSFDLNSTKAVPALR
ncbi:MAG: endolytic transglycosylase MltG [Proteobacteria bacterium]|nr:endolytic transglycosylase MltG [Pseudomonadota bacterium]